MFAAAIMKLEYSRSRTFGLNLTFGQGDIHSPRHGCMLQHCDVEIEMAKYLSLEVRDGVILAAPTICQASISREEGATSLYFPDCEATKITLLYHLA